MFILAHMFVTGGLEEDVVGAYQHLYDRLSLVLYSHLLWGLLGAGKSSHL